MRINAPIAPPTTAGTGMEDLPLEVLELAWPGRPELLDDDGFGELVRAGLEGVGVAVLEEVSVGDEDDGVGGGSDEDEADEGGTDGV